MSIMSRRKLRNTKEFRIRVHKTAQHFYAQLIDCEGNISCAHSTLAVKGIMKKEGKAVNINFLNTSFVKELSSIFAEKIKKLSVSENVFYDRGKKKYCGLIEVFANGLRENGISI